MVHSPKMPAERSAHLVAFSTLIHLVGIAALLIHWGKVQVAPVHLPGTARGTRLVLTYLPGPAPSASAVLRPALPHRVAPYRSAVQAPVALAQALAVSPAAAQPAPGSGVDALGQGDISIALMQFFPDPQPDLSRLPHGSRGDVVLEAVIDATGHIAQLTVKQGLGHGIDESVAATVAQWTFTPAMRDGRPVSSQQEFHFHYEHG